MKSFNIIFVILCIFLLVGSASALTWTSAIGCWTASDSYYNYVMWNTTGSSSWKVPTGVSSVAYLVVGGGGGSGYAGNTAGGAGGAGGFRNGSSVSTSGNVSVIVGNGGSPNAQGGGSTFSSITSSGGGLGGNGCNDYECSNGQSGGSGGSGGGIGANGFSSVSGGTGNTPATSPSQGNNGAGGYSAGGGGGIGSASTSSTGGSGIVYYIGNTALTLSVGGSSYVATANGGSNTGDGGSGNGASGGSGLVIITYPKVVPTSSFTYSPSNGANTLLVNFTDTTNNPTVSTWSWVYNAYVDNTYSSTATFSNTQNPSYTFGTYGVDTEYKIYLTTSNGLGSNISTQTSWVNTTEMIPTFTTNETNPNLINNKLPIQFVDTTTPTPTSWSWDFGDGGNSTSQTPIHTYTSPGEYSVNEIVYDPYGGYTNITNVIPVYIGVPYPSFTFPATATIGNTVLFVNTSYIGNKTNLVFNWSFGDLAGAQPFLVQTGSDIGNATHIYNYYGLFTPSLTITNNNGTATYTSPTQITVMAANSTSSGQGVTWFTPVPVSIQLVDEYGNPAVGATIDCNFNQSTLSGGMNDLFNYYGMSVAAANSATNGALIMSGTTDSTGTSVFTMVNALSYTVGVNYKGTTATYYLSPSTSNANFVLRLPSSQSSSNLYDNIYSNGNTWTKIAESSDYNFVTMMFSYQDTSIYTTRIDYYIYDMDTIPSSLIYTTNVTNPAQNAIYLLNYTVPNTRGNNYMFYENVTRSA